MSRCVMDAEEVWANRIKDPDAIDYSKGGKCSGCGSCCSSNLDMDRGEVRAIRGYLKKHPDIRPHNHTIMFAGPHIDGICPFRNDQTRSCDIYPVRPAVCRSFDCSKPKESKRQRDQLAVLRRTINVRKEFFDEF